MDDRERAAWRKWRLEPTPENAQQWAVVHSRTLDRPEESRLLEELDLSIYPGVSPVLKEACDVFLGTPFDQVAAGDLHWITESHYWLLKNRPSPRTLRELSRFYADCGLELGVGEEEEARRDHDAGLERQRGNQAWKNAAERAQRDLDVSKKQASRLQREVNTLKSELARSNVNELSRLKANNAGLEASYRSVKEENERLTRLLQEAKRSK